MKNKTLLTSEDTVLQFARSISSAAPIPYLRRNANSLLPLLFAEYTSWCNNQQTIIRRPLSEQSFIEIWMSLFSKDYVSEPFSKDYNLLSETRKMNQFLSLDDILSIFYVAKISSQLGRKKIGNYYSYMREVFIGGKPKGDTDGQSVGEKFFQREEFFDEAIRKLRNVDTVDFLKAQFFDVAHGEVALEKSLLYEEMIHNAKQGKNVLVVYPNPDFILALSEEPEEITNGISIAFASEEMSQLYQHEFSHLRFVMIDTDLSSNLKSIEFIETENSKNKKEINPEYARVSRDEAYDWAIYFYREFDWIPTDYYLNYISKNIRKKDAIIRILAANSFFESGKTKALVSNFNISRIEMLPNELATGFSKKKALVSFQTKKKENSAASLQRLVFIEEETKERNSIKGKLLSEPWSVDVSHEDIVKSFSDQGKTITAIYNSGNHREKDNNRDTKWYDYSKEIRLYYSWSNGIGHYAYYSIPKAKDRTRKGLLRGKRLSERISVKRKNENEVGKTIKKRLLSDEKLQKIIAEDIKKGYKDQPLSLKTYWYCARRELLDNGNYNDKAAQELMQIDPIANAMSDAPLLVENCKTAISKGLSNKEDELKRWRVLTIIMNRANRDMRFLESNVHEYVANLNSERKGLYQARKGLVKKSYTIEEEKRMLDYCKKHLREKGMIGAAISFYTGMSNREIAGLSWSDIKSILGSTKTHQFWVYKEVDDDGIEERIDPNDQKRYRRIPIVTHLKALLDEYKSFFKETVKKKGVEPKDSMPIAFDLKNGEKFTIKPQDIKRAKDRMEKAIGITPIKLESGKGSNRHETDFNEYQADRFRSNFEYRMMQTCGMSKYEREYLLGNRQKDTYANHYCDFTSDFSQVKMLRMLERWSYMHDRRIEKSKTSEIRKTGIITLKSEKDGPMAVDATVFLADTKKDDKLEISDKKGAKITITRVI